MGRAPRSSLGLWGTHVHRQRLTAKDVLVERLGLGFGLGVELALEDGHAHLVLAQGGATAPELHVESHERSVHGLLERIEGHEPKGRLHGGLGGVGGAPQLGFATDEADPGGLAFCVAFQTVPKPGLWDALQRLQLKVSIEELTSAGANEDRAGLSPLQQRIERGER